jgi:hypothetical protein
VKLLRKGVVMSGLRAEKRMDKNGKLVTRHIQYGEMSPAPHKLLPSVFGLFGKDDRFPGKTKEMLDEPLKYLTGSERRKMMSTLNDDTMRALHSVGVGLETDGNRGQDADFRVVIQTCREEGSFALLNNIAFFAHDEGREEKPHTIHSAIGFVKGLIKYQPKESSRIDYTTASEKELDEARKLLAVARGVSFHLGSFVESNYDMYTGKGDKYINSPFAVSRIRDMDKESAMELASFVVDRDIWFDNEDDVQNAFETFALRRETHDALDDGVL